MSAPVPQAAFRGGTAQGESVKIDRPWSDAELQYVTENLARGYTYSQIAWGLGRSKGSIASAIRRMREASGQIAPALPRSKAARSHVYKRVDQVAELLSEGFTLTDIAEELGLTRDAVKCSFKRIKRRLGAQAV